MKFASLILTGSLMMTLAAATASAAVTAFPGAEGFGAYAAGGRSGDVYYVENLNGRGPGSFADAIATVPTNGRTILFKVSGFIPITKTTVRNPRVTIAGQTAPGDGIGLKGGSLVINASEVIVRHLRIRYGDQRAGGDCLNIGSGVTNVMLDHISAQFSTDENMSSFDRHPRPDLITFQWSFNAWGLETHSCGGLWDVERVTTHHTLWAHNHTRNPKARPSGVLDWINNVTYDWDIGFILGDSQGVANWSANVRGNYFICPPGNLRPVALEKARRNSQGEVNFTLFTENNLIDNNGNALLDGVDRGSGIASGEFQIARTPIVKGANVPMSIDPPLTAYKKIVSAAGALRLDAQSTVPLRDEVDVRLIQNLVTLQRHHITNEIQTGASNGGMGTLNSAPAPADSDADGMPDYWEQATGSNVNVDDHNAPVVAGAFVPAHPAGHTRLEEYLHFLAVPHAVIASGTNGLAIDLRRYTSGFTGPTVFKVSNVAGGTVTQSELGGGGVRFVPEPRSTGRARFDFEVTDAQGSKWMQTFAVLVAASSEAAGK
jgi:pectate lyase